MSTQPNVIIDSSVILAYVYDEPGAEAAASVLSRSVAISSVNMAEVVAKLAERGWEESVIRTYLDDFPIIVVAFNEAQAYICGVLRPITKEQGLSLGDRACLALGIIRELPVVTADRNWARVSLDLDLQLIR